MKNYGKQQRQWQRLFFWQDPLPDAEAAERQQVATADNATAASTSTGAADSAAPETAGEVDGTDQIFVAVAFGNQFRCAGYGMALDDGRVLRRTDA